MTKLIRFVFGWCVILALLLGCVRIDAFSTSFYEQFYKESNLASQIGVSEGDLNKSMDMMLDYVLGKRENLDDTIIRYGKEVEVYNEKEKTHMMDVKHLYDVAMRVLIGAIGIGIGCVLWITYRYRDLKKILGQLCAGLLSATLCFLLVIVWLGIWILTDFTDFWTHFHGVFFTNDLWLLDPATDFMIVICPEKMFFTLVVKILIHFMLVLLPLEAVAYILLKKKLPIGSDG